MTHSYAIPTDRVALARASYRAYETGDRAAIEALIADEFRFWSPADEGIDRATYFERCWPNAGHVATFEYVRLRETGGEVLVTYEATRADGTRFRNTEIFGFAGDRIASVEVYFGWDLA